MKNSVSERSLYIESEEEDTNDEEEVYGKGGEDENGHDSDSSESSSIGGSPQQNRPSPYNTSWPQSYSLSIKTSSPNGQTVGYYGNGLANPLPPANGW